MHKNGFIGVHGGFLGWGIAWQHAPWQNSLLNLSIGQKVFHNPVLISFLDDRENACMAVAPSELRADRDVDDELHDARYSVSTYFYGHSTVARAIRQTETGERNSRDTITFWVLFCTRMHAFLKTCFFYNAVSKLVTVSRRPGVPARVPAVGS